MAKSKKICGEFIKSLELWKKSGNNILMLYDYYDPIILEGKGCLVKDMDGNELLDFSSGQFCMILGHNHPEFNRRLSTQMNKLVHTGTHYLSPPVIEASNKLAEIAPGNLDKVVLLSTGTEANECAIRIAKAYTRKTGVVGFSKGYSGISLATRSVSSKFSKDDYSVKPHVPDSFRILTPDCFKCPVDSEYPGCKFLCLKISKKYLGKNLKNIAAYIFEPVLSDGGVIMPPPGYLVQLKKLAQKHGSLLIADEAQTGFGRTGKWFCVEHHRIVPDILMFAKGAGNGIPVSGVIITKKIEKKILKDGFWHISSHQSDPLGGISVSAVIDIINQEKLLKRAERMGKYLKEQLENLKSRYPIIFDVRGIGLMQGIELALKKKDKRLGKILEMKCIKNGLIVNYTSHRGAVFRIFPPLIVKKEEIDMAISIIDTSLKDIIKNKHSKHQQKNPYSREKIVK